MDAMDWDDLRIIAAIRDSGTFAGAGVRLAWTRPRFRGGWRGLQKTLGSPCSRPPTAYANRRRSARRSSTTSRKSPGTSPRSARWKRGARRCGAHPHCHHQFARGGNSGAEVGAISGPQSRSDAAVHDVGTERQFRALGGGPGRPAAQAGEGQFHDHEAGGRPPLSVRTTGGRSTPARSRSSADIPMISTIPRRSAFLKAQRSQDANPMHNGQSSRDTQAGPVAQGDRHTARACLRYVAGRSRASCDLASAASRSVASRAKSSQAQSRIPRRDRLDAWAV